MKHMTRKFFLRLTAVGLLCAAVLLTSACTGHDDPQETGTDSTGTQTGEMTDGTDTGEAETSNGGKTMDKEITIRTRGAEGAVTDGVTFGDLSLGTVQAESWLKNQLLLLADNIAADFEQLSPDCASEGAHISGWLGGDGESWERGTYYVRGLVSLAYELDNDSLKTQVQKWIDWTLNSQAECGAFGPYASSPETLDYWPLMPMLMALESYYDVTQDARVIPFLEKYFAWEAESVKTRPLSSWGKARGGDNILAVYWLYEKTSDPGLLDLCRTLYAQTDNWAAAYDTDAWGGTYHIVNMHESFKLFPLMYAVTGDASYLDVYYKGIENLYMASGRADGMSNGDEVNRGISAVFGTETCAVVERMLSDEIALLLLKDAALADSLELLAYNALPQQLLPDGNGQVYFTMQNQIAATLGSHGFTSDGGDRSVYGTPGGYPCCIHNYMMGWPLFASSLWMRTSDGGLAAGAYGPSRVTLTVGNGTHLTLTETTDYPFKDTVTLTVEADKADTYPLYLRVPGWCAPEDVTLTVNGQTVSADWQSGTYFALTAEWASGDEIVLTFKSRIRVEMNENNSVSVKKGAVLFALAPEEKWATINYNPNNWNLRVGKQYTSYSITAASDWNLALSRLSLTDPAAAFTVTEPGMRGDTRFVQADAPIILTASAVRVPGWTVNQQTGTAGPLPISPLSKDQVSGGEVTVRLIPYGFTRIRLAAIPWCGDEQPIYTAQTENGVWTFENVIAPSENAGLSEIGRQKETYTLTFEADCTRDMTFDVYVNRKPCGTITLHAGKDTVNIEHTDISSDRRSLIELKAVDANRNDTADIKLGVTRQASPIYVYDAKDGNAIGAADNTGAYVRGIDQTGDGLLLPSVRVRTAGTYRIRIYYCAASGDGTQTLYCDDAVLATVKYAGTGGSWGVFSPDTYAEVTVDLPAGEHVIKLVKTAKDTGFAEIRTLEFELTDAHDVADVGGSAVVCRIEAESGTILGKCYNSGGTHVAGIDNVGDGVEVRVTIPADGRYIIRVNHSGPMGAATHTVKSDGVTLGKLRYPGTSTGWGQFSAGNYGELFVELTAGQHILTIIREADDTGFAEVDTIAVIMEE